MNSLRRTWRGHVCALPWAQSRSFIGRGVEWGRAFLEVDAWSKVRSLKGSHCERDGRNSARRVGGLPREKGCLEINSTF